MEDNDYDEEFDDFFDTPGRSVHDYEEKGTKESHAKSSKSSPSRSVQKQDRNESNNYSSDFVAESDNDSKIIKKRGKQKKRSRSSSSRSAGSYSSTDSYSSTGSRSRRSSQKKSMRKNSRSSSSSRSRSRSPTPDSSVRERKGKGRRRSSYSSVTSSSTDSESEGRSPTPTPRPKEAARRTAWDTGAKPINSRQDRPKTAKGRSISDKLSGGNASRKHGQKENNSPMDSDSDMTDVSPILSPRNGSVHGRSKKSGQPAVYQAMPMADSGRHIHDGGDSQALDLSILMKAVSELEKEKRVKSNTRRVMFEPLRARPMDKSNYTFNDTDTYRIEQENKRLLQKIMRQVHEGEERRPKAADIKVKQSTITASAVNRRKEQKRIESDNLSFLRRLQKIRPSRGISRNEQLTAYNSTVLHGIPISTLHPMKTGSGSGRSSRASSMAGSLGRTRSMTSIHSAATTSSFGTSTTASHQSSRASSRPTSAKKSSRTERPPWDERW